MTTGDGVSGVTEIELSAAITGNDCIKACEDKRTESNLINGATFLKSGENGCFCEKAMASVDTTDTVYETCRLKGNFP